MFCKNCGEPMNDNQAICLKCGVKKGEGNSFCPNCGKPTTPGSDVCLNCGVSLKNQFLDGNLGGQSKLVIALLCFFLGSIGIHNFVMGETKKGIVKIIGAFVCGISAILALIDLVKILIDKYTVDPNAWF
ncbi:MAG: NINE protein [Lachnospiraceae bacterium]|nr:NINE protein [Lachnospiraceae bacterium]